MSTRNLPGGKGRPARKADLTTNCEPIFLANGGASTSHNPTGLRAMLQGELYLFTCLVASKEVTFLFTRRTHRINT
jgi:hypothetical protein